MWYNTGTSWCGFLSSPSTEGFDKTTLTPLERQLYVSLVPIIGILKVIVPGYPNILTKDLY